ncbi:hypothetical protein QNA19_08770 [Rhodococcus fascians]|uniref:hypothetical protein n=1 Tax=Rhodococcoides fascians TaxID=1828 RepID=UPI0024BAB9DE|nr:hypothetical protein [Rhodococcus fascians]MDJ0426008.1 hypothetical protein [Rhodococcus fascians]
MPDALSADFRQYSPVAKNPITPKKLRTHVSRQYGFLTRSIAAYDTGETDEALRIATVLRVLLHDTNQSKSLLGQVGVKSTMRYWDTARYADDVRAAMAGIAAEMGSGMQVVTEVGPGILRFGLFAPNPTWVAPLDDAPGIWSDFSRWWSTPVIEAQSGTTFTRWDLVRVMANQDGGAHVDPSLDVDYDNLQHESFGVAYAHGDFVAHPPGGWTPLGGQIAAECVRQFAFEMVESLRKRWPDLAPSGWSARANSPSELRRRWLASQGNPIGAIAIGVVNENPPSQH